MTVKAKPLVWVADADDPDCIRSGEYWIYHEGLGYQAYFGSVVFGDPHKTLAAAQDAVWQHHAAYVLAAIEAPDHLALVAAAYRDAAERASRRWAIRREHADKLYEMDYPEAKIDAKTVSAKADEAKMLASEIADLTPADAEAHLTALLRAGYERGVREAAATISAVELIADASADDTVPNNFAEGTSAAFEAVLALLTQEGR